MSARPSDAGASASWPERDRGSAVERPVRPVLDVRDLADEAFGSRGVVWWGTIGFMVVESVTLAACLAAYFYLKRNFVAWPPLRVPDPDLVVPTIGLLVLLVTCIPIYLFERAAKKVDARGTLLWLWVSVGFTAVASVIRFLEFGSLNVRWDANAYGSVTWVILVTHFTLLIVDVFETGTLAMIFTLGKHEPKHYVDATDNAFYSYFMVLAWVPCYITVYLVPIWA